MSLRDLAAWEASASRGPEPVEAAASRAARHLERQEIAAYLYVCADQREGASRALLLRIARNIESGTYKQTNKGPNPCSHKNTQK